MGLFSVFDRHEKGKRLSHVKNLLEVAFADGEFNGDEEILLKNIAKKFNMSGDDIFQIKNNPDKIKFTPPSSYKQKVLQIYDFVKMMLADNDIHENEVKICKSLALKLNLSPLIIDDIIDITVKSIMENKDEDTTLEEILKLN